MSIIIVSYYLLDILVPTSSNYNLSNRDSNRFYFFNKYFWCSDLLNNFNVFGGSYDHITEFKEILSDLLRKYEDSETLLKEIQTTLQSLDTESTQQTIQPVVQTTTSSVDSNTSSNSKNDSPKAKKLILTSQNMFIANKKNVKKLFGK